MLTFCLAFVVFGIARVDRAGADRPAQNKPAPHFLLADSRGRRLAKDDMAGRKYGLLFFRADCDYCIDELKQMNELLPKYQGSFALLLVSSSDARSTEELKKRLGLFSDHYTAIGETLARFNVNGFPMLALVNERGEIAYTQMGMRSLEFQTLVFDRFMQGESLTDQALRAAYQDSERANQNQQ
jgi:peroxiredoxin